MFKKHMLALAVLAGIGGMSLAQADDLSQSSAAPVDKRFYVAPYGTFITTGSGKANNGWGGGLAIGKMLDQHFNVEVKGFYNGTDYTGRGYDIPNPSFFPAGTPARPSNTHGNWNLTGATVDVQYFFNRNRFAPYGVIGLGGMTTDLKTTHTRPDGVQVSRSRGTPTFVFEAGAGFTFEVADNFLIRSDVRYRLGAASSSNDRVNNIYDRWNSTNDGASKVTNDMTVNVGFVIPFGAKPRAPEVVAVAAPEPVVVAPAPYVAPPVVLPPKQERE